jgi:hypothetical protein
MRRAGSRQSGFLLLEIVVAVGLLVFGLAMLGSRLQRSEALTHETDELARVIFLAESKLAELDTGLVVPEQDVRSDFGKLFPRYGWRMRITPTSGDSASLLSALQGSTNPAELGMFFIELEVLFDAARVPEQDFDFENAQVVQRYYTLRAPPRSIDLSADFGLEEEIAEKMNEDLANAGINGFDVHDFNPTIFRDMDLEQLQEVLPIFMQAFDMTASQLVNMLPQNMRGEVQAWLDSIADDAGLGDEDGEGGTGGEDGGKPEGVSGGAGNRNDPRGGRGGRDGSRDGGRRGNRPDRSADDEGGRTEEEGDLGGRDPVTGGRGGGPMEGGRDDRGEDGGPRGGGRRGPRGGSGGGGQNR